MNIKIIRSKRKTIILQIKEIDQVILKVPNQIKATEIEEILKSKEKWIKKKHEELSKTQQFKKERTYVEGEEFLYLGKYQKLKFISNTFSNLEVRDDGFYLGSENTRNIKDKFYFLYIKEAKKLIEQRVEMYEKIMNVKHKGEITISKASYIWGSCSPKNELKFNYRLIMAPIEIVDYVIVHELAHIINKSHSPQFWEIVGKYFPEYKKRETGLNFMEIA